MFIAMINDIQQISKLLDDKIVPIQKVLSQHGKILKSLKKDQNTMLGMLDDEQMKQRRRLKRVEEHLGLTSSTL